MEWQDIKLMAFNGTTLTLSMTEMETILKIVLLLTNRVKSSLTQILLRLENSITIFTNLHQQILKEEMLVIPDTKKLQIISVIIISHKTSRHQLMIVFIIKLFLLSNTMVRNLTPRITS